MKILVDADACPVKEIIENISKKYNIELIFITDTSHFIHSNYGTVITVDKQTDSADFAIINRTGEKDLVITQDYGLASMVLAKKAYALNNYGNEYTKENIDRMLFERHLNKKARLSGLKTSHHKKRTAENNEAFQRNLIQFLEGIING